MPVGKAPSQTPPRNRSNSDWHDSWAIPLGRVAGARLSLSYTVFFAAAIVVAVVLTAVRQEGNEDLPRAAVVGTAFWVGGWLIQFITHQTIAWLLGLRTGRITLGLIGVEALPRRWSASSALLVSVCTVGSLLVVGMLYRLIEGGFRMPVLSPPSSGPWDAPSIGFADHDSMWRSAAWLCFAQAVFQMYPLPRTMGRQIFAAMTVLSTRQYPPETQAAIFRRCISAVALVIVASVLVWMSLGNPPAVGKWLIFALLGLLLWGSSRASDVTDFLEGFRSSQAASDADAIERRHDRGDGGVIASMRHAVRSRRARRRARIALARERSEAVDAQRLDEVLGRLHRDGIDSLDMEDRRVLQRVSENLRRQREAESNQDSGAD